MANRILITDDMIFMRLTLRNILIQHGYVVVGEAVNGIEAVKLFQELRPDVVTMDITMPEMDGITALRQIRQIDEHANVIMCTAMGQKTMVVEAIHAGARDFIIKPFQPDRVVEAMRKFAA